MVKVVYATCESRERDCGRTFTDRAVYVVRRAADVDLKNLKKRGRVEERTTSRAPVQTERERLHKIG
jgi:hypothetical protein